MENTIEQIQEDALAELENADSADEIKEISVKYVGRKGRISLFLRNISRASAN